MAGLAISSQAETGIPLDRSGNWLYPAITWFDDRSVPERDWLARHIGSEPIFRTTGLTLRHIFTLPKLLWLKRHHPARFRHLAKWLWLPDFINWRLTGDQVTEYSIASRGMVFDIVRKRWDDRMCQVAGLSPSAFPTPVPAGSLIGHLRPEAARRTSLPQGLPVFTGGHDHLCGAFALGATAPGLMLDSIGTAESLVTTLECPLKKSRQGYSVGCHVVPNRYYLMGGLYSASAVVEWVLKNFAPGKSYDWLIREASRAPEGPTGILFLPHLWGSSSLQSDPSSRAALTGLRHGHGRAHVLKALFEGLCFEADAMRREVERLTRTTTRELLVTGGATNNPLWMKTKSHVSRLPLKISSGTDAVTLGAALLAGKGLGVFPTEAAMRRNLNLPFQHLRPSPTLATEYGTYRPAFEKLYDTLKHLDTLTPA